MSPPQVASQRSSAETLQPQTAPLWPSNLPSRSPEGSSHRQTLPSLPHVTSFFPRSAKTMHVMGRPCPWSTTSLPGPVFLFPAFLSSKGCRFAAGESSIPGMGFGLKFPPETPACCLLISASYRARSPAYSLLPGTLPEVSSGRREVPSPPAHCSRGLDILERISSTALAPPAAPEFVRLCRGCVCCGGFWSNEPSLQLVEATPGSRRAAGFLSFLRSGGFFSSC
mmetsp:Transcript_11579/g.27634  ORF Transcript_11579/g.27634 Transcript_11579/m.27634 type:complete len:225 (+) Transcript_11579:1103-1777(+)